MEPRETQEPSSTPSEPDERYHGRPEILAAISELYASPLGKEIRHLEGFARFLLWGRSNSRAIEPEDLIQEAIAKTLAGKRKWKREISFRNHLMACMRSHADNQFRRRSREVTKDVEATEDSGHSTTEATSWKENQAHAIDSKRNIERLESVLKDDSVALDVLHTMADGYAPLEAKELLAIPRSVYWAARKRIRRAAEKLHEAIEKEARHG